MKRGAWLPAALPKGLDPDDLMVARQYRQLSKVRGQSPRLGWVSRGQYARSHLGGAISAAKQRMPAMFVAISPEKAPSRVDLKRANADNRVARMATRP
jgi:hypothetical protein